MESPFFHADISIVLRTYVKKLIGEGEWKSARFTEVFKHCNLSHGDAKSLRATLKASSTDPFAFENGDLPCGSPKRRKMKVFDDNATSPIEITITARYSIALSRSGANMKAISFEMETRCH